MKERPILYSAPMVRAKLAGRKTQTRRVAKFKFYEGQNPDFSGYMPGPYITGGTPGTWVLRSRGAGSCWNDRTEPLDCPYGMPRDRLWGRETFMVCRDGDRHFCRYRADEPNLVESFDGQKWKPSIFMPRWASRILDAVVSVRVERLQDVGEADAMAEGIECVAPTDLDDLRFDYTWPGSGERYPSARDAYLAGWETINGKGSAEKNPWVWVIETRAVAS
jgi:hypothetical protein